MFENSEDPKNNISVELQAEVNGLKIIDCNIDGMTQSMNDNEKISASISTHQNHDHDHDQNRFFSAENFAPEANLSTIKRDFRNSRTFMKSSSELSIHQKSEYL